MTKLILGWKVKIHSFLDVTLNSNKIFSCMNEQFSIY